jgi:hypothetical protein
MLGTLSAAGLSAMALNAAPVAHSHPAPATSAAATSVQQAPYPYCYVGYANAQTTACSYHWGYYGWHRHHWAAYLWHHYGQSGRQAWSQPAGAYTGAYGYHSIYAGMSGYVGTYAGTSGNYGYGH